jgi:4-diphosphocytidyl-2-C-methyl-D-erythritol kinase
MHLRAAAKINLHLRVGPPRADGFHPLMSWMCTVGLFDEIRLEKAPQSSLTCDDPTIPTGPENLVLKAAAALGITAKIELIKRIPAGGGLAGGSADAAATLFGLNQLDGGKRTQDQLLQLARGLGSDVPFFLHGPSSICVGVGDIVRPTPPPPAARWALLILPPFSMPTPKVYQRFDQMKLGTQSSIDHQPDWQAWAKLKAHELLPLLVNDLEPPAFDLNPSLARLREDWQHRLNRPVRMSGSGSTLFTLYDDQAAAEAAAGSATNEKAIAAPLAPGF